MAYGLYLSLDQDRWFRENFSSTEKLTGTIYTDINQTSAKDLTGFTINIRLSRSEGPGKFGDFFNKTASAVVAANGTWSYAVQRGEMPTRGLYYVTAELSAATTDKMSTLNRVQLYVLEGPTS